MLHQGTVRRIAEAALCFIEADDASFERQIFAHFKDFARLGLRPPRVADRVEFDVIASPKGFKAGASLRYAE
jgi:cold shock CspA family protein